MLSNDQSQKTLLCFCQVQPTVKFILHLTMNNLTVQVAIKVELKDHLCTTNHIHFMSVNYFTNMCWRFLELLLAFIGFHSFVDYNFLDFWPAPVLRCSNSHFLFIQPFPHSSPHFCTPCFFAALLPSSPHLTSSLFGFLFSSFFPLLTSPFLI